MTIAGLRYHFERIALRFLWKTPLFHWMYRVKKEKAIIMYHGIDSRSSTQFNLRHCGKSDFKEQLKYLMKHYDVVPLKSLFEEESSAKNRPRIAVTMDDGFETWHTNALQVIQELKCPVTLFISRPEVKDHLWLDALDIYISKCSDPITVEERTFRKVGPYHYLEDGTQRNIKAWLESEGDLVNYHLVKDAFEAILPKTFREEDPEYWRLMTDEQIKELAQCPHIEIASHGKSHIPFTNLSMDELKEELESSKNELETLCRKEVVSVSYPIGKYNPAIVDLCASLGYRYQLAVDYQEKSDQRDSRILPRVGVYSDYAKEGQMKRFIQEVNQAQW